MELKDKSGFFVAIELGDTVYHVNPYTRGSNNQKDVLIENVEVFSINANLKISDRSGDKSFYIPDLLASPDKKTFTNIDEARVYLTKIHKGFARESVSDHHYSCRRL